MISPLVLWNAPDNQINRAKTVDVVGCAVRRPYDRAIILHKPAGSLITGFLLEYPDCAGYNKDELIDGLGR